MRYDEYNKIWRFETLNFLKSWGFSPQKEPFYSYFSMPGLPTPMKLSKSTIYRPILMKFGVTTEKNMLSPKTENRKCAAIFKDGGRCHLDNQ
jgi:hypothetical protein